MRSIPPPHHHQSPSHDPTELLYIYTAPHPLFHWATTERDESGGGGGGRGGGGDRVLVYREDKVPPLVCTVYHRCLWMVCVCM